MDWDREPFMRPQVQKQEMKQNARQHLIEHMHSSSRQYILFQFLHDIINPYMAINILFSFIGTVKLNVLLKTSLSTDEVPNSLCDA